MKRQRTIHAALAATLALALLVTALPVSLAAKVFSVPKPAWTVPEGYNEHDYTKCVEFLEQTDENGVKNGQKLSEDYDPNDPETWGTAWNGDAHFQWTNGRLWTIYVYGYSLIGSLDVSGCTALTELGCGLNYIESINVSGCTALTKLGCGDSQLTELDVSSCTALVELYCRDNRLTELDVTQNTALVKLWCGGEWHQISELDVSQNTALIMLDCGGNRLTELDVTQNTALTSLHCYDNRLTELDVTKNTALTYLSCDGNRLTELDVTQNTALGQLYCFDNRLTELDLRSNPELPCGVIRAEGNGCIGYSGRTAICAQPSSFASFDGFYTESDELIAIGTWGDINNYYFHYLPSDFGKANVIAHFSPAPAGAPGSGDINGDGAATADDAIIDLRAALGLITLSEAQLAAGDMNGDGVIDVSDAILVLRTAMGLTQ